jgi:hypothetical protein
MNIKVDIPRTGSTTEGFAPVNLVEQNGARLCQLDIQYSKFGVLPRPNPLAVDFLLLAATIYSLDKLVLRKKSADSWTRDFSLQLPVSNVEAWNSVKRDLDTCLSFLTGDFWEVQFIAQASFPIRRSQQGSSAPSDAVCLFSGGLDSLIGAIDWIESNERRPLMLVGHHDWQMKGPLTDQNKLLGELRPVYPGRILTILVRVGHTNETVDKTEISLRARSLLFISLGVFVASALGNNTPLLIPENGTIALNIPLTPSRRGSCSTRTAHPHYLGQLHHILASVGITNRFSNPLESKTKGEAVAQCLNRRVLERTARLSVSCAKRGHKRHYTHRDAKACGRCMPCIYRRAALHTVGLDNELYGDDICLGEVDINDHGEKANDLRACLAFLRRNAPISEISSLLLANGSLEVARLPDYANTVQKAMNEIRNLFRDKATPELKRLAGI